MPLREPFPGFPPPLTTRPEGLLSMLGLQTNGAYPQHLAGEYLQPTLDLLPWYLESRAEIQSVQGFSAASTLGQFHPLYVVPANEVWVLLNFTLQPTASAISWKVQLARARSNDLLSRVALSDAVTFGPAEFPLIGSSAAVRFLIFRPTVQIGFQATFGATGTNGGNVFNSCLRFVRCSI